MAFRPFANWVSTPGIGAAAWTNAAKAPFRDATSLMFPFRAPIAVFSARSSCALLRRMVLLVPRSCLLRDLTDFLVANELLACATAGPAASEIETAAMRTAIEGFRTSPSPLWETLSPNLTYRPRPAHWRSRVGLLRA